MRDHHVSMERSVKMTDIPTHDPNWRKWLLIAAQLAAIVGAIAGITIASVTVANYRAQPSSILAPQ